MIKNKQFKNILDQLSEALSGVSYKLGMILMTAAAVTGMLELPNHQDSKITLINQPVMAFAGNTPSSDNPLRREKESTETSSVHYSYSAVQRTPARSIRIK